jgi:hypothetical protein
VCNQSAVQHGDKQNSTTLQNKRTNILPIKAVIFIAESLADKGLK